MPVEKKRSLRAAVEELIRERISGARVVSMRGFGIDAGDDAATEKAFGYGKPLAIRIRDGEGRERMLVLHRASPNAFGHDRRADRAAEMLLAFDSFSSIPQHVEAIDVGAVRRDGRLLSLADTGEFFVLTSYAEGHPYADELRALAERGHATERDLEHCRSLAAYLAELHRPVDAPATIYARAVRDLVGSGEGIFGLVDGYDEGVPGAPLERLRELEHACVDQRWRLKKKNERLRRIHGDFHPFNVLFDDDSRLGLLDASRGCAGDPADDLTAMSVNYLFFALQHPQSWKKGYAPLWRTFWETYAERRDDAGLLEAAPAYLTWRLLVVANPRWYPHVGGDARDRLLGIAEQVLARGRVDPEEVARAIEGR